MSGPVRMIPAFTLASPPGRFRLAQPQPSGGGRALAGGRAVPATQAMQRRQRPFGAAAVVGRSVTSQPSAHTSTWLARAADELSPREPASGGARPTSAPAPSRQRGYAADTDRIPLEVVPIRRHAEHTSSVVELLAGLRTAVDWQPRAQLQSAGAVTPATPARPQTAGTARRVSPLAVPAAPTVPAGGGWSSDWQPTTLQAAGESGAKEGAGREADGGSLLPPMSASAACRLESLTTALGECELFAGLPRALLRRIVAGASVRELPRYQQVYRQGARAVGLPLYVWLPLLGGSGEVKLNGAATDEAVRARRVVAADSAAQANFANTPGRGGGRAVMLLSVCFGVEGCARGASERVRADTVTVEGGSATVLCVWPDSLPREVGMRATALANARCLRAVRGQHIFAEAGGIFSAQLIQLLRLTELRTLRPGEHVLHEGDETAALYTVVSGAVRSWVRPEGRSSPGGGGGSLRQCSPIVLDAAAEGPVHFGLEAVAAWLQTGGTELAQVGASFAASDEGASLLFVPAVAFQQLLKAVPGLGPKVEAALLALERARETSADLRQSTLELDLMRHQCRATSWNRYGAPIDSAIDLMRVAGRPAIPTSRS
ncbi:hypothetical protein T492DRAFT_1043226 [Pavlovales sp. CCMP2436]|nr:hypothetical protein T492DRAFT_1043226 [Pavlovales sp. CCMP2436]